MVNCQRHMFSSYFLPLPPSHTWAWIYYPYPCLCLNQVHSYSEWTQWRNNLTRVICCRQLSSVLDTHFTPTPKALSPLCWQRPMMQVSRLVSIHLESLIPEEWVRPKRNTYESCQFNSIVNTCMSTSLIIGSLCCLVIFCQETHEAWK